MEMLVPSADLQAVLRSGYRPGTDSYFAKKLNANWRPLFVSTQDSIPKLTTKCYMNILAIHVAIVFAIGTAFTCFG